MDEQWITERHDQTAVITLNRPESSNSLSTEVLVELGSIVERISQDTQTRALIIQGSGKHFSAGMDPEEFSRLIEYSPDQILDVVHSHLRILEKLEGIPQPTIAKISGFCLGGGVLLSLCCDFRVASQRTIFSFPEVNYGIPVVWGTYRVVRVLGPSRTKELLLTGQRFDAAQALEWGLVHRVLPPGDLERYCLRLADRLADKNPATLTQIKRLIAIGEDHSSAECEVADMNALQHLIEYGELREVMREALGD